MIVTAYYLIIFVLISICSMIFFLKWNRHVEFYFSMMFFLFPLTAAGYVMIAFSKDVGNALCGIKFTYFGGCFLSLFALLTILHLSKIRLSRWITFSATALSFFVFFSALTAGFSDVFYKDQRIVEKYGTTVVEKEYGPLHSFFYPMIILYFLLSFAALVYSFKKKNEASRKNLLLLFITVVYTVFSFFIGRKVTDAIEWAPSAFLLDAIIYLFIVDRISLYNIGDTVSEILVREGEAGYVSLDLKGRFLAATPAAKRLFPTLEKERADLEISDPVLKKEFEALTEDFMKDEVTHDIYIDYNTRIYRMRVKYLTDGKRKRGFQIKVEDDTDHRQYLKTLEDYNKNIKEELALKTEMLKELRPES